MLRHWCDYVWQTLQAAAPSPGSVRKWSVRLFEHQHVFCEGSSKRASHFMIHPLHTKSHASSSNSSNSNSPTRKAFTNGTGNSVEPVHDLFLDLVSSESSRHWSIGTGHFCISVFWSCFMLLPEYWSLHVASCCLKYLVCWWMAMAWRNLRRQNSVGDRSS